MESAPRQQQVVMDGVSLLTLLGSDNHAARPVPRGTTLLLSRFAWIRRDGARFVVEISTGPVVAVLEDPRAAALVLAFGVAREPGVGLAAEVGLPAATASELVALLHGAGLLLAPEEARGEDLPPQALWEFHDLLFHARSRPGRSRLTHGGTYRFLERIPALPALPEERLGESLPLPLPDYDRLEREDPPLAEVQELRRSIRQYDSNPLTLSELGEFLYRVGRVEDAWEVPMPGPGARPLSFVAKPYPSGGAAYELELYAAVQACQGLDPGLYHYAAAEHRLVQASAPGSALDRLLARNAAGMGVAAASLQVVVVITARFGRLAWKYESIAYELVLKHVGVVLQTMYLAATAMKLAPCAIGTGDSDLFAQASGIDYYEEPAVGELALGSHPTGNRAQ